MLFLNKKYILMKEQKEEKNLEVESVIAKTQQYIQKNKKNIITIARIVVGVALAGVLLYMAPSLSAILSKIFLKEHLGKNKIIAIILNLLGASFAVTGGSLAGMNFDFKGIIFGFIAALIYASVTVSNKYFMDEKHIDASVLTFYLHLFGFITTAIVTRCWTFDPALVFCPKALLLGLAVGGVCSLLPYYLYILGLSMGMEASTAPVLSSNEVIVSVIIGAVVFGEGIGFVSVLGILFVLGSIVLINKGK